MKATTTLAGALLIAAAALPFSPVALAQDEGKELGWSDTADFSLVMTGGNTEITTLGFNNNLQRKWEKALFEFKIGALRAKTTSNLGFAVGSPGDFVVPETTAVTAENYYALARYDRNITKKFFWYVAAGWLRNEFAGIRNRYTGTAGVGNIWYDREKIFFRTNYGLSYTDQEDVVAVPGVDRSYPGVLLGWNLLSQFTKSAQYGNDFIYNYNSEESKDWRAIMDQWIAVSMTERLALKVSLQLLYNNDPAIREYELRPDLTSPSTGSVFIQLDELDTIFGVSLVVDF